MLLHGKLYIQLYLTDTTLWRRTIRFSLEVSVWIAPVTDEPMILLNLTVQECRLPSTTLPYPASAAQPTYASSMVSFSKRRGYFTLLWGTSSASDLTRI